jgi:hypothetical protein
VSDRLQEAHGEALGGEFGLSQQRQAEVQAEIRSAVATPPQLARQLAVSTAQVEDGLFPLQGFDDAPYPRLQAAAGGGKSVPKLIVELTVEF